MRCTIRFVVKIRRALHVVTALVAGLGIWVGATTSSPASEQTVPIAEVFVPQFAPPNAPESTVLSTAAPGVPPTSTAPAPVVVPPTASAPPADPASAPAPSPAALTTPAATVPGTLVARVTASQLLVYERPGDARATINLQAETEFGNARVLVVTQRGGDWLRVLLPTRPNGSEGWIRARDVALSTVDDQVTVDLASRTLVWTRSGVEQIRATVAVGAATTPTPTGQFFVTDVLPESPTSAYGDWIIALNGHSDAFTTFDGGDPRIAIHGTNDPSSIGGATSSGCVRVEAPPLDVLARSLPLGTPVLVR